MVKTGPTLLLGVGAVGAGAIYVFAVRHAAAVRIEPQLAEERRGRAAALEQAAADLGALQQQLHEQRDEARRQQLALAALESKLLEQHQQHAGALKHAEAATAALKQEYEEELSETQRLLGIAEQQLEEQHAAIRRLESKLAAQQQYHASTLEKAASDLAASERRLQHAHAAAAREAAAADAAAAAARRQQAAAEQRLQEQRAALARLEAQLSAQRAQHVAQMEKAASDLAVAKVQLQQQCASSERQWAEAEQQQAAARQQLEDQRAAAAQLQRKLSAATADLQAERAKHAATAAALAEDTQQLVEANGKLVEARGKLAEAEGQLAEAKGKLAAADEASAGRGEASARPTGEAVGDEEVQQLRAMLAAAEAKIAALQQQQQQDDGLEKQQQQQLAPNGIAAVPAPAPTKDRAARISFNDDIDSDTSERETLTPLARLQVHVGALQSRARTQPAPGAAVAALPNGAWADTAGGDGDVGCDGAIMVAVEVMEPDCENLPPNGTNTPTANAKVAPALLAAARGVSLADAISNEDVWALRQQLEESQAAAAALQAQNALLSGQLTVANELLARMNHLTQALQSIRRRSSSG